MGKFNIKSALTGGLVNAWDDGAGGVSAVADPYGKTREALLNWLTPQIGKPGPTYTGETTAPMSEAETKSFDYLNKYGNSTPGPTYSAASKQIQDTLNNQYDPSTSQYYQAVKAAANTNLADTKKQIASDAAAQGRYFTGSRMKQQARAETDTNNTLNTLLGSLAQQERQNQLSVLPLASQMGQYEQGLPLQQATAYQTLGALPRTIQQNADTTALQQFQKANYDWPLAIAQLAAGVQQAPLYQQNPPGLGEQIGGALGQAGSLALMMAMMGGCWVAREVFGGNLHPKSVYARYFVNFVAPQWFTMFYVKHGERIAEFIRDKAILKSILRPVFEVFALIGAYKLRAI